MDNSEINSHQHLVKYGKQHYEFSYIIDIYAKNYNMFEIVGSQAGMKFTLSVIYFSSIIAKYGFNIILSFYYHRML